MKKVNQRKLKSMGIKEKIIMNILFLNPISFIQRIKAISYVHRVHTQFYITHVH